MANGIAASGASPTGAGVGRYRWVIVGLLFAATAINYIDRQMIGVLKPTLRPSSAGLNPTTPTSSSGSSSPMRSAMSASAGSSTPSARDRLYHRHRHLDDQPHGPRPGVRCHVRSRWPASVSASARSGNFPAGIQRGGGLVPGAGARLRDRPVQRRCQCRRHHHAAARAAACRVVRLAGGLL